MTQTFLSLAAFAAGLVAGYYWGRRNGRAIGKLLGYLQAMQEDPNNAG